MSTSLEIVVICSECGEELDSEVTMEDWKTSDTVVACVLFSPVIMYLFAWGLL